MKKKILLLLLALLIVHCTFNIEHCTAQWEQFDAIRGGCVYTLAVSGSKTFAGTFNGVYLSTNSGSNWTQSALSDKHVTSFAVSGNNSCFFCNFSCI